MILLAESRLSDVKSMYPGHDDVIDQLSSADPSGNMKYLRWMAAQVLSGGYTTEETSDAIKKFHSQINRITDKDIMSYDSVEDVIKALPTSEKSNRQIGIERKSNSDVIYKDDRFVVVIPHDREASCAYGHGTRWCISATDSQNYFDNYSEGNTGFFMIFDKRPTRPKMTKVACAMLLGQSNPWNDAEWFDAADQSVDSGEIWKYYGPKIHTIVTAIDNKLRDYKKTKLFAATDSLSDPEKVQKALDKYWRSNMDENPDNIMVGRSWPIDIVRTSADDTIADVMLADLQNDHIWDTLHASYLSNVNCRLDYIKALAKRPAKQGSVEEAARIIARFQAEPGENAMVANCLQAAEFISENEMGLPESLLIRIESIMIFAFDKITGPGDMVSIYRAIKNNDSKSKYAALKRLRTIEDKL